MGRFLISADHSVSVWDASTCECSAVLRGHNAYVGSATFSPDGNSVLTGSEDKSAKVWDASTGTCLLTLAGHQGRHDISVEASFSDDGRLVITASGDRVAKVWDATTGDPHGVLSKIRIMSLATCARCR